MPELTLYVAYGRIIYSRLANALIILNTTQHASHFTVLIQDKQKPNTNNHFQISRELLAWSSVRRLEVVWLVRSRSREIFIFSNFSTQKTIEIFLFRPLKKNCLNYFHYSVPHQVVNFKAWFNSTPYILQSGLALRILLYLSFSIQVVATHSPIVAHLCSHMI